MNAVTLIYTTEAIYLLVLYFIEFHLEVVLCENFKSKPLSLLNSTRNRKYFLLGLCLNLFALVAINQVFQNQYSLLKNSNRSTDFMYEKTSIMCKHDKEFDDFQSVLKVFFEDEYENENPAFTA